MSPVKTIICIAVFAFCGCNVVKRLKPGERLYTGATVKVDADSKTDRKKARRETEKILRPKPNQTVLGIRFKLWLYQVSGEEPKKKIRRWVKYKLGEKPVLYDPQIPVQVSDIAANRLNNLGYFNARVTYTTVETEKKVSIKYEAHVSRPYTIASVAFPDGPTELERRIGASEKESLLKPGTQYNLDVIRDERSRIDLYLKNNGYYFFNADHLLFKADSTKGDRTVALRLLLKPETPLKARTRYFIDRVYIYANYRMRDNGAVARGDTSVIDGYYYVARDSVLHPSAVLRSVVLHPGDEYSRVAQTKTISRLMSMGIFHYVNVKFNDTLIGDTGRLTAYIYLTPMLRRSVQLELQAVTKSNNYTGPAVTGSYRNRNQFGNAELFVLNLNSSFETQFSGIQKGFNSYELGASGQLSFPRFITPFRLSNVSTTYVPRTKIDGGFRNLNRVLYFAMDAAHLSYGYNWKETAEKNHELNPIALNFARVTKTTAAFEQLLQQIPFLRSSFEEQFTIGGNYAFTYNSLTNNQSRNQYYFNGLLDVSGNSLYFLQSMIEGRRANPEQPFKLFNYKYSQYTKVALDGRYTFVFNKNSKLATRAIAGAGYAYLNSQSLPYIKQFFSGGANSIRAFLPRTVGPGTYVSPDSAMRRGFLDQAGDVKLELNVEYRFTIISVLKGALFLDGGNVWLIRDNPEQPGGKFYWSEFYKQLAVGSGFGLRVDVTYFVLRFDLGVPLRKPYLPYGQRWVYNKINFGDKTWRKQNLVLNIAIGYPF